MEAIKTHQNKTKSRLEMVRQTVDIFEKFYKNGHQTKRQVYTILCIHHPKYHTKEAERQFGLIWNFVQFQREMINDLQTTINKIN